MGQQPERLVGPCPATPPSGSPTSTYRGKPHVGGQGVYTRHLTKALVDLGHHVEVLGGQPYPDARRAGPAGRAAQPRHLQRPLPDADAGHLGAEDTGPTSSRSPPSRSARSPSRSPSRMRAWDHLRHRQDDFDLVHDNQCLGYGLLAIERDRPAGARHDPPPDHRRPPPRDGARRDAATSGSTLRRWYAFTDMQTAGGPPPRADHHRVGELVQGHRRTTTRSTPSACTSCPVGVDPDLFRPLPGVDARSRAGSSPPPAPTSP